MVFIVYIVYKRGKPLTSMGCIRKQSLFTLFLSDTQKKKLIIVKIKNFFSFY